MVSAPWSALSAGPALVPLLAALVLFSSAAGLPHPQADQALVLQTTPATPSESPQPQEVAFTPEGDKAEVPPPQVRSLHVDSDVQFRYAHTVVSSRVANPANRSQEVTFSVVLPETAYISSFFMEVDGKVYKAHVEEKKKAKETYDAAVASGQSAAHVAVSARDANSFTVSVNVERQNKVSFNLTYEELLSRSLGIYSHKITLNPGQVVDDLQVRVLIKESKEITKLRVPEFSSGNKVDEDVQECDDLSQLESAKCKFGNKLATFRRISPKEAEIIFRPSAEAQKDIANKEARKKKEDQRRLYPSFHSYDGDAKEDNKGLNGQFVVEYDVVHDPTGGEVMVNDGYFVHFFSPPTEKPLKKHAIFVLDVSGSMEGRRIEQLREAMLTILGDLRPGDFFTLIQFSSGVKIWDLDDPENSAIIGTEDYWTPFGGTTTTTVAPVRRLPPAYPASTENVLKAKEIVKKLAAFGGTNIYEALKTALKCARAAAATVSDGEGARPEPILLFLTDGDPTVGETTPSKITAGISDLNQQPRSSVFSLAFGEGADIKFLRKLSLANGGFARNIYEAADTSNQLSDFYKGIASPLLANVTFKYLPEQVEQDSMTQLEFRTYFWGAELVVAGRTVDKSIQQLDGTVSAVAEGGNKASFKPQVIPIDDVRPVIDFIPNVNFTLTPRNVTMMERLWAYLQIKQLLDKQDAQDAKRGKDDSDQPQGMDAGEEPTFDAGNSTSTDDSHVDYKKKALNLALKYSFVTPVTSLVVVKPNETKATDTQTVTPGGGPGHIVGGAAGLYASGVHAASASFGGGYSGPPGILYSMSRPGSSLIAYGGHVVSMHSVSVPAMAGPVFADIGLGGYGGGFPMMTLSLDADSGAPPPHQSVVPQSIDIRVEEDMHSMQQSLNISDVTWLPEDTLVKGTVSLPVSGSNTTQIYRVAYDEADVQPPPCKINTDVPKDGWCRHLSNCVLDSITGSIENFYKYQCTNGDYLSICCPFK